MDLRLELSEQAGWSVLLVGGEVDVATAPRLREQLIKLVNDQRFQIVADATREGGYPPLLINPIDFAAMYQQNVMSEQKQAGNA